MNVGHKMTAIIVGAYTRRADAAESVLRWSSEVVQNLVELVYIAASRCVRQWASTDVNGFTHSRPLKIGLPPRSSAKMHPTDQTSMAVD